MANRTESPFREDVPVVLVVDPHDWSARTLESVLEAPGYAVLRAQTGQRALSLSEKVEADAVIVSHDVGDMSGAELARALRSVTSVGDAMPLVAMVGEQLGAAERRALLKAGIWRIFRMPVDPSELVLSLQNFIRARQEIDRSRDASLKDFLTGLYNEMGVRRRALEMLSEAHRYDRPATCLSFGAFGEGVAFFPEPENGADRGAQAHQMGLEEAAVRLGWAIQRTCRGSDIVARVGRLRFQVLAPNTGLQGARDLARRLLEALEEDIRQTPLMPESGPAALDAGWAKIGLSVLSRKAQAALVEPEEWLKRADRALADAWSHADVAIQEYGNGEPAPN